ncbi:hypothetical protein [Halomonas sp. HAL1]|uniref:hypothetical protein n=1 Tax=Halomonas sp. HAL1 TaxID=550984 RepID=UPI00022D280B|nr:hypothetical protein [Halomonas sp. HAL1]EHA14553.1 hypothetical protein HAL1_16356 [Halomonas sp. HAL1]WKV93095.1 hypothetical protein Q3Y66_00175 [Halomonas sp. HAL1]
MVECLTLARRIDTTAAQKRLQRLGANACEPAWVRLWAAGLGVADGKPGAWLLSAHEMRRALLLVGAELPAQKEEPSAGVKIDSGSPPTPKALDRLWLWERIATPRHWRIQMLDSTPVPIWLPCWLGYARGRQLRLTVLSGLSGETLPMLKPIVLKGLQQAYRNGQESATKNSGTKARREKAV